MFRKNGIRGVFILTVVTVMMMAFTPVSGANEPLIVNGDFEDGNVGFDTDYFYVPPDGSMYAENTYAIGDDPRDYHSEWASFGDHTTGTGMMMIVNGFPLEELPIRIVWGQEVNLPAAFSAVKTYPMFANGDSRIGDVLVKNSAEEICVEFVVTDPDTIAEGWLITEAHVAIGYAPGDIPQNKRNLILGKFEIRDKVKPSDTVTGWYCQPYDEETIVAAHAELVRPNIRPRDSVDGWGGTLPFEGKDPATYIEYDPQEPIAATYRFTMWGASSYWENPAVLEVNFGEIPVGPATLTLPEDEGEWVKVEYDFEVSPAETIYVAIRDSVPTYYGDDFVIDDISLELLP